MLHKVVLDTVIGEDPGNDAEFEKYLNDHGITHKQLREVGPAGGWPEIEYSGTEAALKAMILEYWDDEDLYEYIEQAR